MSKEDFIEFLIKHQALKLGHFTLKSGRESPYFFNLGVFNSGASLAKLGEFYAAAIMETQLEYELLFGPAYKGIVLAATTSIALYQHHLLDIPYAFNRKETKDHGDGGQMVGSSLQNRKILMLDDVITAGTTVHETLNLLKHFSATLRGIVIAFDRQERGEGTLSATEEVSARYGIPIVSLLKLEDVIAYLRKKPAWDAHLRKIEDYVKDYGSA